MRSGNWLARGKTGGSSLGQHREDKVFLDAKIKSICHPAVVVGSRRAEQACS
jgi:hypothetical protein